MRYEASLEGQGGSEWASQLFHRGSASAPFARQETLGMPQQGAACGSRHIVVTRPDNMQTFYKISVHMRMTEDRSCVADSGTDGHLFR